MQQRITEAQAQLQAFTTQCQEATEALHKSARVTSKDEGLHGSLADTGVSSQCTWIHARDAQFTPENAEPNTDSCIWRTVGPDPQVSCPRECLQCCCNSETGLGISVAYTSLRRRLHGCSQCWSCIFRDGQTRPGSSRCPLRQCSCTVASSNIGGSSACSLSCTASCRICALHRNSARIVRRSRHSSP